jgi:hypothetical protein
VSRLKISENDRDGRTVKQSYPHAYQVKLQPIITELVIIIVTSQKLICLAAASSN